MSLLIYSISNAQIVNIPDTNFKNKLLSANTSNLIAEDINGLNIVIDINNDGEIQISEALDVYQLRIIACNISDLTGIEAFVNLTHLYCKENNLTTLDISNNTELILLNCIYNNLNSLDTSNNIELVSLTCGDNNNLNMLDISNNVKLDLLWCGNSNITNLDLSNNILLTNLSCGFNPGLSLDLSNNPALTDLTCMRNHTNVDVTNNPALINLSCYYNNLTALDLSNNPNLAILSCMYNNLTTLDISNCPDLFYLNCVNNNFTTLDLSSCSLLRQFYCNDIPNLEYINLKNGNNHNLSVSTEDLPSLTDVCVDELGSDLTDTILSSTGHSVNFYTDCSTLNLIKTDFLSFSVYPTPTDNILNIKSTTEISKIEIYSKLGQLIKETTGNKVDISNLTQGLYFVKVEDINGNFGVKKIVKK